MMQPLKPLATPNSKSTKLCRNCGELGSIHNVCVLHWCRKCLDAYFNKSTIPLESINNVVLQRVVDYFTIVLDLNWEHKYIKENILFTNPPPPTNYTCLSKETGELGYSPDGELSTIVVYFLDERDVLRYYKDLRHLIYIHRTLHLLPRKLDNFILKFIEKGGPYG